MAWTAVRHRPSSLPLTPWRVNGAEVSFADYVTRTHAALDAARRGWEPDDVVRAQHVEAVAPREWPLAEACQGKARAGVLLIHGLSDTPYSLRDLGDVLAGRDSLCLRVRSILLPGHGGVPGDLLTATAEDWRQAVRYGVASFAGDVDTVHLVGFSLGGALALDLVLKGAPTTPAVGSLVLLAPAVGADNRFPVHKIPFGFDLFKGILALASGFTPKGEWLRLNEDLDFARHESFPLVALQELMTVMGGLSQAPRPLTQPVFMAFAAEDQAVDSQASLDFFRAYAPHPKSRLLLSAAPATLAAAPERYADLPREDPRITCLQGVGPDAQPPSREASCTALPSALALACPYGSGPDGCLVSSGHLAPPIAPTNPHYGAGGDYRNCLGYLSAHDPQRFCACVPDPQRRASALCQDQALLPGTLRQGEPVEADLKAEGSVMARLGYNPHFNTLAEAVVAFFE
ncbi:alpha/beta hydrolase [Pararhodospirillum photometricum]|uniref:Lipoprotein, putative n=1 Tax=Pararhodospirillum photometricum DSM 122 TaxID=1150469 RepID=H6SNM3_PARPM|nr:alpha/beta fold hydrolase [Pararhodospirillum photometricum]CCG09354.1 Lipoprotein, putative [Pararhodospirillum photometricum DSM 122]